MTSILNTFFDNLLGYHSFDLVFNESTLFSLDYSLITSLVILISLFGVFIVIIKCLVRWLSHVFKFNN